MNAEPLAPHREWSLTALVLLETIELFVLAPLNGRFGIPVAIQVANGISILVVVLIVVSDNRSAVVAVLVGGAIEAAATVLRVLHPSERTETLDFAAALIFLIALTIMLGLAVFGPGRVTVHRILGAIAIYLNIALVFALAFRLTNAVVATAFGAPGGRLADHELGNFVYFSFTTLTTSGYGDIVPVDPIARSLANLESVIGQLFPATLLARLITLEIASRP